MNIQIGAQLWLFHSLPEESCMEAILTQLKAAGYAYVETMYGKPPRFRSDLDRVGMECYATHVALCAMPSEAELADFMHGMGAKVVCVSGLLEWDERSADDFRRSADSLNALGSSLLSQGLALHYHNHDFEFAGVEGEATGMDLLLSRFDSAVVSLCFDAGWAYKAGGDPVRFMSEQSGLIRTIHLRDFVGSNSVPLGAGDIDLPSVIASLSGLPNLQAILVEQDPGTETPVEDMAESRRFLKERFGL